MRKFIFIWFLGSVLLVGIISALGALWTGRTIRLAAWSFYESDFVHYIAQTAVRALDEGGVPALEAAEKHIDPDEKMRFLVFDTGMNEISGGPAPGAIRALAGRLRPQDKAQFQMYGTGLVAGSIVTAHDGREFRVIVWFPARRVGYVPINAWGWAGRIAAIVATAGLLCSWLAWCLSTPLMRLRLVARQFASGDLKARADASSFPSSLPEYRELARDFDEMAGRIETLVDSQRQLLRDVSHELRTPLTRLNLAVNNARHAPASAVEGSLDRIDQESERLNTLIDRILRLSRFDAFAAPPHREIIELADFMETIVSDADFEATARKRRVSLVRAGTCRLAGDRELLREAIENIVRNAIRYTPEGTTVTVDAWRENPSEYRIVVRDCGPGVPAENIGAIFEPFYRAPQRADPESPGFGIGLAIAKRAIGLHHGTITACNLDGGGFEIAIRLPVPAAAV
ncbi:MAG TPA: ATP-binding protein [Bryobacteraceae bacterium]|nr:ATP-binding protein [Bryobacteraceae bacterium]